MAQPAILLVDDDDLLRTMYARKFEEKGAVVEALADVLSALEKLRTGFVPDAIVFDIVMPGIDGYGFLEKMRQEKLGEKAVKIALSNNQVSPEEEKRAQSLGLSIFITKASNVPSEIVDVVLSKAGQH